MKGKKAPKRTILTAWPEPVDGPGMMVNRPVFVLFYHTRSGELSVESLQPTEQSPDIHVLYDVVAAANRAFTAAVKRLYLARERLQEKGRGCDEAQEETTDG